MHQALRTPGTPQRGAPPSFELADKLGDRRHSALSVTTTMLIFGSVEDLWISFPLDNQVAGQPSFGS